MPGGSGEPVVTTLVCFVFYCMRGCGCIKRPASPRPLLSEGKVYKARLARKTRGEIAKVYPNVIASEAKQSSFLLGMTMDCFACARNDGLNISSSLRKQGPLTPG